MTTEAHDCGRSHGAPWRIVGWSIPALLLLLPLVSGAPWTLSDFVTAGAMVMVAGVAIELALHSSRDLSYRVGARAAAYGSRRDGCSHDRHAGSRQTPR